MTGRHTWSPRILVELDPSGKPNNSRISVNGVELPIKSFSYTTSVGVAMGELTLTIPGVFVDIVNKPSSPANKPSYPFDDDYDDYLSK